MYFIEKLVKLYLKFKKKDTRMISANFDDNYELEDVIECKHHFIAIDSSGNTYACTKCGYLVTKDRLQKSLE